MASCSEQFLKFSRNSVQRSKRSTGSGLEMGTDGRTNGRNEQTNERKDGHKDHYIFPQTKFAGGIKIRSNNINWDYTNNLYNWCMMQFFLNADGKPCLE